MRRLRALFTLSAMRYAPKSNIHLLFMGDMGVIAKSLMTSGKAPSSEATTARDIEAGFKELEVLIKKKLEGKFLWLSFDEASTKLAGRQRPIGVSLGGAELDKPILVDLRFILLTAGAHHQVRLRGAGGGQGRRRHVRQVYARGARHAREAPLLGAARQAGAPRPQEGAARHL